MNTDPDYMPDRWRRILQRVATGEAWRAAAKAEGCSESYSRVIRTRMMKNPAAARELKQIQAAGSEAAGVTLAGCIAQAQEDRESARRDKAHMAAVQATKLVCQLSGHLVDRIQVETVDMKGALLEARTRVFIFGTIPPNPLTGLTDAQGTGPDTDSGGQDGNGPPVGDGPETDTPTR
jgi:hypothetical protein